jgi:hypothetical protein
MRNATAATPSSTCTSRWVHHKGVNSASFVPELRHSILVLHKALLDAQQIRYEREHGRIKSSGELLGLVLEHPSFAWLRQLSALIARLDEWIEMRDQIGDDDLTAVVNALRDLISVEHRTGVFGKLYWDIADDVPEVLVAHVKLWRLITEKRAA